MAAPDPKHDLPLICRSQSFPVKKTLLMEKFSLFLEHPKLLGRDSYDVKANVTVEVFSDFLKAAQGTKINISEINAPSLLALCTEFGYEPLRADCAKHLQPKANPSSPSPFLEERVSRQEMELATVQSEIGLLRQSISEVRELFERRGGLIAPPSPQGNSSAIESRFASLENEVSVLRQRLESEQLYRQGQEYLFGDHQYEKSALLGLTCLERSASLGHSDAAYCYGTEFSRGDNCSLDISLSVKGVWRFPQMYCILYYFENLSISLNNSKAEFDPPRIPPPEENISARHCP
jgi:hypothetical protein